MEFKEAMRIWKRMCEGHRECKGCPAAYECVRPTGFAGSDESKIEATLTEWAKVHPEKTIADDFFEKHPNAPKDIYGLPSTCARDIGYLRECPSKLGDATTCHDCWRRPLEEVEG